MTIEELKDLIAMGQDCGESEMKALWPEIMALVEAANNCSLRSPEGETYLIDAEPGDGLCEAIDAFNAKLSTL